MGSITREQLSDTWPLPKAIPRHCYLQLSIDKLRRACRQVVEGGKQVQKENEVLQEDNTKLKEESKLRQAENNRLAWAYCSSTRPQRVFPAKEWIKGQRLNHRLGS